MSNGDSISVYQPADKTFYPGTVTSVEQLNPPNFNVSYDYSDKMTLNLEREVWHTVTIQYSLRMQLGW